MLLYKWPGQHCLLRFPLYRQWMSQMTDKRGMMGVSEAGPLQGVFLASMFVREGKIKKKKWECGSQVPAPSGRHVQGSHRNAALLRLHLTRKYDIFCIHFGKFGHLGNVTDMKRRAMLVFANQVETGPTSSTFPTTK